jgi:hypothetical protein
MKKAGLSQGKRILNLTRSNQNKKALTLQKKHLCNPPPPKVFYRVTDPRMDRSKDRLMKTLFS